MRAAAKIRTVTHPRTPSLHLHRCSCIMTGYLTPLAWPAPMYSAEHMAQFNSQLPQPKPKWAVRPIQKWYHKHGSGGLLDDPR